MLLAAAAQVLLAPAVLGAVGVVGRGQAQEAALQVPDHPLGTVRRRGPLPLQSAPPAEEQTVIHLTESLQDLGNLSDSKSNRWMGGYLLACRVLGGRDRVWGLESRSSDCSSEEE